MAEDRGNTGIKTAGPPVLTGTTDPTAKTNEDESLEKRQKPHALSPGFWPVALLILVLVAIDQVTKYIALQTLTFGSPVPLLGPLKLQLEYDPRTTFSALTGESLTLLGLSVVLALLLMLFASRTKSRLARTGCAFAVAGLVGNTIDHFGHYPSSAVVDFLTVGNWYVFNIADIAITAGILLIVVSLLYNPSASAGTFAKTENKQQNLLAPRKQAIRP